MDVKIILHLLFANLLYHHIASVFVLIVLVLFLPFASSFYDFAILDRNQIKSLQNL